ADESPLDATEDIVLKRTLVAYLLEESEELCAALMAWHRGEPEGSRPPKVPDFELIMKHLDSLARMSTAVLAQQSADRVSRPELDRVVAEMAAAVRRHVEPDIFEAIMGDWRQIRRPEGGR
ncbi:MAG: hypothetical protein HC814_03130, partial [Rhodobacteraceae bacterium]|nr:hypothetical protein [Paracoccaceae bacterium]